LCRVTCLGKKFLVEADNRDTFLTQGKIKNFSYCNYDLITIVIFNSSVVGSTMNIAVNLLQVKIADGFDVMCDSVFLSCVNNGIASFDVYVLERQELQDPIFIIAEHCDPSQDAPDMIISCESPPVMKFIYIYLYKSVLILCGSHRTPFLVYVLLFVRLEGRLPKWRGSLPALKPAVSWLIKTSFS
jgi:hypothetical protein